MKRACWWGVGCALVGVNSAVMAQQPQVTAASTDRYTEANRIDPAVVLARPVTVSLKGAPLREALAQIGMNAKVLIQYQSDVLDGIDRRVTRQFTQAPLGVVLEHALQGTPLQAVPFTTDGITIERVTGEAGKEQGVIVGKVTNKKTGAPVVGATILLSGSTLSVTTNTAGEFRMQVPSGDWELRVRAVGYVRHGQAIVVTADKTTTVSVTLEQGTSVLDEVIVTGTVVATARKEITTPITVIRGEELERRGITRIEQLFRGEVPGVLIRELGTHSYNEQPGVGGPVRASVYSRGASSEDGRETPLKTYIDGVEMVDPTLLGTIDPQSIERIEIINGPQAATIYGSGAMGGVMQIFTKKGTAGAPTEVNLTLRYGILENSFSDGKTPAHNHAASIRGGTPPLTYSANLSYGYSGQWQPKLYSRRIGASLGAAHTSNRTTVDVSYVTTMGSQGTWNGSVFNDYGAILLFVNGDARVGQNYGALLNSQKISLTSSQNSAATVSFRATTAWQHRVTVGRSQTNMLVKPLAPQYISFQDTIYNTTKRTSERTTWNYNTSSVNDLRWFSSTFTAGVSGSWLDEIGVYGSLVDKASPVVSTSGVTMPLNDKSWGGFATWQIGLWRKLYTSFGLRAERNPNYGENIKFDFTPSNGLSYTIEQGSVTLKLLGSYGRATRAPHYSTRLGSLHREPSSVPSEFYITLPNMELRPEYSRGPQGGFELYIGNIGSLTVNHYQQKVTDLIQRVIVDSIFVQRPTAQVWVAQGMMVNTARTRQFGWEGTGALQLGPINVRGTYSWMDSRVLAYDPSVLSFCSGTVCRAGVSFTGVSTHTGSFTLGYSRGGSTVTTTTNWMGASLRPWDGEARVNREQYARLATYNDRRSYPFGAFVRINGYAKTDLSGSHRVSNQVTLTLNVINVMNAFESDRSDLSPSLGRQTTLGLSYRFHP